jgi:MFS family permease
MLSLSLALVCNAFPPAEQPRALGIWAAVSAVALAIGPLAGGLLIEIDWRVIFWMNLPVAALGIAITAIAAPESTDPESGTRIDWAGLAALSVGVTALVLALVQSNAWSAAGTVALAALGLVSLAAFWRLERRVADPIVDFTLFRNGPYFGASAAAFALVGSYWAVMFFQPQYLQDVLGHSPIAAGLLILPITAPMIFLSPFSGRLIGRFGARRLMSAGMLLRADVDGGDGGDAGGEGRHRLRGAGDGPGPRRRRRPGGHRRGLPRPARQRRGLRRRDRRLDLVRGRPLRGRRRPHLGLSARPEQSRLGPGGGRRAPSRAAAPPFASPAFSPVKPKKMRGNY